MSGRRPQRHRGPKGPIGLTGSAGAAGSTSLSSATPFWMEQQEPEDVFPIPGSAGVAGIAGAPGAMGLPGFDGIDGEDAIGPLGWPAFGVTTLTTQVTGALNDYNPGLGKFTVEHWSGVADAAFTGLRGGAAGHIYIFKNTGTKVATFAHQSGASAAGNKYQLPVTSAPMPVAANGFLTAAHDGVSWRLVGHSQGSLILNPYNATDWSGFGGMTWTVDPGDVTTDGYYLEGNLLTIAQQVVTSSVSGGNPFLAKKIPGGFTCSKAMGAGLSEYQDNGGNQLIGGAFTNGAATTTIFYQKADGTNWSAAVNTTAVIASPRVMVD